VDELRDYIERWGMLFERLGGTRMMGKVLGWLLVCDPPEQTAASIAEAVGASAGSVSTTTRALEQMGMIERFGVTGKRSAHFRVKPFMWGQMMRRRMASIVQMGELSEEGIRRFSPDDRERALRLRELGSYCDFIQREFPEFVGRWEKQWGEESKS
jgi:DNA-binding Lrp family transcriptional regulator